MNASRIAVVASVAAVVLWAAKAVTIGVAGGLGKSPLEGPLFLAGAVCLLVGIVAIGLAATVGHGPLRRIFAVVAMIVASAVVVALAIVVVDLVQPSDPGWAWGEVNLWVVAALGFVAATRVARGSRPVA